MSWGATVQHWSVTNLPADNLLRADFCLGEPDPCFTWSHLINGINREGFCFQQRKPLRHWLLFLGTGQWLQLSPGPVLKGFGAYLEREANKRWWCEGDHLNTFVGTDCRWSVGQHLPVLDLDHASNAQRTNLENISLVLVLKNGLSPWCFNTSSLMLQQKTDGGVMSPMPPEDWWIPSTLGWWNWAKREVGGPHAVQALWELLSN